jgi:hypothetical protein
MKLITESVYIYIYPKTEIFVRKLYLTLWCSIFYFWPIYLEGSVNFHFGSVMLETQVEEVVHFY